MSLITRTSINEIGITIKMMIRGSTQMILEDTNITDQDQKALSSKEIMKNYEFYFCNFGI